MTRTFDVAQMMRENGIEPGISGNRNQPDVAATTQIINERREGAATVVSPTGEIASENNEDFQRLCQSDSELAKKVQFLKDMKVSFS